MADDQNELTARLSINHYKIVSLLGSGGMGKVYLAEDRLLERKVALKLLPSEFASDLDRLHRWDLHKSENSTTEEAVKKSFTRQCGEVFRSSLQTVGPFWSIRAQRAGGTINKTHCNEPRARFARKVFLEWHL